MSADTPRPWKATAVKHSTGARNDLPGGAVCQEHFFEVPLDYFDPSRGTIKVFVREVVATKQAGREDLPALLFLQGGPGFPAGRPVSADGGWVKRALETHRVFLLDQRGTGRSGAITHESLARLASPAAQAEHIALHRADNIVRDCEAIRLTLKEKGSLLGKDAKWTLLGQSFGGFCALSYLSMAPEGLRAAIFTGGLAPIDAGCTADTVYRHTFPRMATRTSRFYARYPQHVESVREIVAYLEASPVPLPSGGLLTSRRFLQVGMGLGSGSGMENLHYLLEDPWDHGAPKKTLSFAFLSSVDGQSAFDTNPLYAVGHEVIYCSGKSRSAWSAERVIKEFPEFDHLARLTRSGAPIMFTGEHVFPSNFEGEYGKLTNLKEAAHLLAEKSDWPTLYDQEKLRTCVVPTVAAVYYEDVYVDRALSEATASVIGATSGVSPKLWVTNEFQV